MSLLPSGKDKRSPSTNWWSLWSGQQVLLGGKKLIIFTVQNLLNMFLSGLSSIQKEKYVERDDMVGRKNRSTRIPTDTFTWPIENTIFFRINAFPSFRA